MNFYITGDTHGQTATRIKNLIYGWSEEKISNGALIVLGDAGINYNLNSSDKGAKKRINNLGMTVYCVRGNHEQRPELIPTMTIAYDTEIQGNVYVEPEFPNIKYLMDGGIYVIEGHKTLCLGGAYSVDKYYRLQNGAKWFENELLTESEMNEIEKKIIGQQFDFILTHTCPISWEPTDLFLGSVNQSTVDKSMEIWMDRIKDKIKWQIWCFGHFHADRLERPHVEMFFRDTELLANVWQRWEKYRETGELDWWLERSPRFFWTEENSNI